MSLFLHGVSVPHRKHASDQSAARLEYPQRVTIPMSMHIGAPATPTVKVGDIVSIGTRIGEGKPPYHRIFMQVFRVRSQKSKIFFFQTAVPFPLS